MTYSFSPLTKKERIELLVREVNTQRGKIDVMWREIVALRERVAALEARPVAPYPWQPLPDPIYPVPGPYVIFDTQNTEPFLKAPYGVAGGTHPDPRHTESAKGSGK